MLQEKCLNPNHDRWTYLRQCQQKSKRHEYVTTGTCVSDCAVSPKKRRVKLRNERRRRNDWQGPRCAHSIEKNCLGFAFMALMSTHWCWRCRVGDGLDRKPTMPEAHNVITTGGPKAVRRRKKARYLTDYQKRRRSPKYPSWRTPLGSLGYHLCPRTNPQVSVADKHWATNVIN